MDKIRILLISVLSILVGNIALSYVRNSLQNEYIAETEYGLVRTQIEPSGLMPEWDEKEGLGRKSQLSINFDLLGYSGNVRDKKQAWTGALLKELKADVWQYMVNVTPSEKYAGVYEVRDGAKLYGYWGANGFSKSGPDEVGKFGRDIARRVRWDKEGYLCYDLFDRQARTLYSLKVREISQEPGESPFHIKYMPGIKLPDTVDMIDFANTYLYESDIDLGVLNNSCLEYGFNFIPTMREATEAEITSKEYEEYRNIEINGKKILVDMSNRNCLYRASEYYSKMKIYDNAGQVYVVDEDTREISPLCKLPAEEITKPGKDNYLRIFSKISRDKYDSLAKEQSKLLDVEPIGYFYASYSKDNEVSVTVYNKEGKVIASERKDSHSKYLANNHEGLWFARTVVENMPGPAIAAASYFARDMTEPMKQWQTLFLMPGSIANYSTMIKDGNPLEYINQIGLCVYLTGGVFVFYLFNVKKYGLSKSERQYWMYFILLFGVMAFVAYMIARPKIVQVTCANCGKLRRPDQERCHSCRASWEMPQLAKAGWSIK